MESCDIETNIWEQDFTFEMKEVFEPITESQKQESNKKFRKSNK